MPPQIGDSIRTIESEREVKELEAHIRDSTSQYTGSKADKARLIRDAFVTLLTSIVTNCAPSAERTKAIYDLRGSFDHARIAAFRP